jgi:hypothetical protein
MKPKLTKQALINAINNYRIEKGEHELRMFTVPDLKIILDQFSDFTEPTQDKIKRELTIIQQKFVSFLPVGEVTAWDFTKAAQAYNNWLLEYIDQFDDFTEPTQEEIDSYTHGLFGINKELSLMLRDGFKKGANWAIAKMKEGKY